MQLNLTISFLKNCLAAADLQGSRFYLDVFTDRLTKATSEASLSGAMEQLIRNTNARAEKLHPPLAAQMMRLAASPDGPRVLRWLREQTRLAVMLAACKDQAVVEDALASVVLPEAGGDVAAAAASASHGCLCGRRRLRSAARTQAQHPLAWKETSAWTRARRED